MHLCRVPYCSMLCVQLGSNIVSHFSTAPDHMQDHMHDYIFMHDYNFYARLYFSCTTIFLCTTIFFMHDYIFTQFYRTTCRILEGLGTAPGSSTITPRFGPCEDQGLQEVRQVITNLSLELEEKVDGLHLFKPFLVRCIIHQWPERMCQQ